MQALVLPLWEAGMSEDCQCCGGPCKTNTHAASCLHVASQDSRGLTRVVWAHVHDAARRLHETRECHRGALAASPPWW